MTMDLLGLVTILGAVLWVLTIVLLLYVYGVWPYSFLSSHGYKGPKPIPFLGNIPILFKGHLGSSDIPLKEKYGPVVGVYIGRMPALVIHDLDMLSQILIKEFSSFTDRAFPKAFGLRGNVMCHNILHLEGSEWRRVRGMLTPYFTSSKLKQYIHLFRNSLEKFHKKVENFAETGEIFDAKRECSIMTLEVITRVGFGVEVDAKNENDNELLKNAFKMMKLSPKFWGFRLILLFPFLEPLMDWVGIHNFPNSCIQFFQRFVRSTIAELKSGKQSREDFIHAMMRAHEESLDQEAKQDLRDLGASHDRGKALTEDEMVAQAILFLMAGYDTTSSTLSFLLYNLARHPAAQDRVYQEVCKHTQDGPLTHDQLKDLTYMDMCLDESQRLFPAVPRFDRRCTKSITINGYYIPKDTIIIVPAFGLHHDPDVWLDPEKFDPERFSLENRKKHHPCSFLPFGCGPRICIGKRLAMAEIKMAIATTIKDFKLTLNSKTQEPMKLADDFAFGKPSGGVWLTAERRQ